MRTFLILATLFYSAPGHAQLADGIHYYQLGPTEVCKTVILGDLDTVPLARAKLVCRQKYGPRSPCLVKLEQVGPNDFNATCGAKL